jgi:DNA-binding XRE family transcriptional regulator
VGENVPLVEQGTDRVRRAGWRGATITLHRCVDVVEITSPYPRATHKQAAIQAGRGIESRPAFFRSEGNVVYEKRPQLAVLARQRGLDLAGVARAASVSATHMYQIHRGSVNPSVAVALRIAAALAADVRVLFADTLEQERHRQRAGSVDEVIARELRSQARR